MVIGHWSLVLGPWSFVLGHLSLVDWGDGGDVRSNDFSRSSPFVVTTSVVLPRS